MTSEPAAPSAPQLAEVIATLSASGAPGDLATLGGLLYADDRFDEARRAWERGFDGAERGGDHRTAARLAIALVDIHTSALGNTAAGNGWRARAQRVLDRTGPCLEWGYFELALLACNRPDVDELVLSTERAFALAQEHGDRGLEVRALAESGLALVSRGDTSAGFDRLDEALATICAGEVDDVVAVSKAFCALLTSCERAQDIARAEEWIALAHEIVLDGRGGRPRILRTHCRAALGAVLCSAGRWDEAETAMLEVLDPHGAPSFAHRLDAAARLARLRIAQGRLDEAGALLARYEDRLPAWLPLAELHLARGDAAVAAVLAQRALDVLAGDVTRRTPLLAVLVEAQVAMDDPASAETTAAQLERELAGTANAVLASAAELAWARVLAAQHHTERAAERCAHAVRLLDGGELPLALLEAHRLHAEALAAIDDRAAAVAAARAAFAIALRLGAAGALDRLAALLRSLGATPPPRSGGTGAVVGELTRREQEVLELVKTGRTNAEIGSQLFISAKTVEHHVGRILTKLGVRSRAEAAALAAASPRPEP